MNQGKTIELLRKRNTKLQEENENLIKQLEKEKSNNEKVSATFQELEKLKNEWNKQIEAIKEQRKQYADLISELKKLKQVKVTFEE